MPPTGTRSDRLSGSWLRLKVLTLQTCLDSCGRSCGRCRRRRSCLKSGLPCATM